MDERSILMADIKEPREGYVQVAGIPWLARMIDKARLQAQGQLEPLDLDYPCPMDRGLLQQLGIGSNDFQQIVVSSESDDQIVEELRKRNALKV
jgi:hypothetical protein